MDFKMKFYYEMYKDYCVMPRKSFRHVFERRHGKYEHFTDLINMIEDYQRKKYGKMKTYSNFIGFCPGKKCTEKERRRIRNKYGTNSERLNRRIEYERNLKDVKNK